MANQKRTAMLAGVLVLVGALVVLDRAGLLPGGAPDEDAADGGPATARDLYRQRAMQVADARAEIDAHANWAERADEAEALWEQERESIISAQSVALADQRLADVVKQTLSRRAGINDATLSPRTRADAPPATGATRSIPQPIRVLALEVRFDTRDAVSLWRVLGELEALRGVTSRITSVRLDGPGFKQASDTLPNLVSATVVIEALAIIEPDGGRA